MKAEYDVQEMTDFEAVWDQFWAPKIVQCAVNQKLLSINSMKDMESGNLDNVNSNDKLCIRTY